MLLLELVLGLGQAPLELSPVLFGLGALFGPARQLGLRIFQRLLGLQPRIRFARKLGPESRDRLLPAGALVLQRLLNRGSPLLLLAGRLERLRDPHLGLHPVAGDTLELLVRLRGVLLACDTRSGLLDESCAGLRQSLLELGRLFSLLAHLGLRRGDPPGGSGLDLLAGLRQLSLHPLDLGLGGIPGL